MKITITIEDLPGGKVKAVMNPNGATIAQMIVSGEPTTGAHGLALAAINALLKEQKRPEYKSKIIIPGLLS